MGLNPDDLADDTRRPEGQQQQQQQPTPVDQLPPEVLREELRRVRSEAGKYRVANRGLKEQLAGLDPDGSGRVSLSGVQQEIRSLRIENGLMDVSHRLGVGNVKLLRAYLSEAGSLSNLDPGDPSFAADLENTIAEALEQEPALKTGRPGVSSAAAPTTGARFTPTPPSVQLSRADVQRMSPEEIVAAKDRGLLDGLLGRRG